MPHSPSLRLSLLAAALLTLIEAPASAADLGETIPTGQMITMTSGSWHASTSAYPA